MIDAPLLATVAAALALAAVLQGRRLPALHRKPGVEIDRMIAFRDRLRGRAGDRRPYEETKLALAARTWRHARHDADARCVVVS